MAGTLSGKSVLIAGGTGGLGKAVSLSFLKEAARVSVSYRNPDELTSLIKDAGRDAASLKGYQVDVTDDASVHRFAEGIVADTGRIDVLVNCVGAYAGGIPLWQTEPKVFDRMLDLNLRSGYLLCRAVVPVMLKQQSGAIVNVSSKTAFDHGAGASAYAASKAAAVAMLDSLAADLKGTGVRANSILPSIIDTDVNRKAMPGADFSKWPKPEDIAHVILFLCSEDSKLVHGAAIPVYGDS
ncbi:MAG TPA: SDR family oxidoreductase [Candidatus Angelobacter sp.]|nr:SDR family oxidoreductase [Candidatus Angelobacter sp.]